MARRRCAWRLANRIEESCGHDADNAVEAAEVLGDGNVSLRETLSCQSTYGPALVVTDLQQDHAAWQKTFPSLCYKPSNCVQTVGIPI